MDFIGFDLGKVASQVCIITADGELIERRIKTAREHLFELLAHRLPARVLIESSTESEWVARYLEALGLEVIVADPNFASMYATRSRKVKTDKRDARTLAEACRLNPLRPRLTTQNVIGKIEAHNREQANGQAKYVAPPAIHASGGMLFPVGPIHAGVIEAGRFTFLVAGEVIEDLTIKLGYKHKGIEKLFETNCTLESGWQLSERVSGDLSFAHSMAYCQAVESLAGAQIPEEAHYWRGVFLELERLYNHIGDVAALIHDTAFDLFASEMFALRETAAVLNAELTGHRLLRGINRPGGVLNPPYEKLDYLRSTIADLTDRFLICSKAMMDVPAYRDRLIMTGILTADSIAQVGGTGLPLRASGGLVMEAKLWLHDFRLRHPQGVYALLPALGEKIAETVNVDKTQPSTVNRRVPIFLRDLRGDIFARLLLRVAEVETSAQIIAYIADALQQRPPATTYVQLTEPLRDTPNNEFGLGYVEGWRGISCIGL